MSPISNAAVLRGPAIRRATVWGHFGEVLQGRLGADGPIALVTLAAPGVAALSAQAIWAPVRGAPLLVQPSPLKNLGERAFRAARRQADAPARGWGGRLQARARSRIGGGCGASTAVALAALRVAAPALGAAREAEICLSVEGAVDPLMRAAPGATLWASRQAEALARLSPPPRFLVVGGHDGPPRRTVDESDAFDDVSDLAAAAVAACAKGDRAALAEVATASAERRRRTASSPHFQDVRALAADIGALGVVIAHTGSAAGLLFAPEAGAAALRARAALSEIGLQETLIFETGRAAA
ncbi:MAG: propanediol utilization protein [Pseudomonadota bacterium]